MITKIMRWAPLAIAGWALLAFVSWHYESTCGVFFNAACLSQYWEGLRWLVLLKWVMPYQTLLGGIGAVAAGAFVLIAAKRTAEESARSENAKRKQGAIIACSIIADKFRDARMEVDRPSYLSIHKKALFPQAPLNLPTLHSIDPMLGSVISALKRDIEDYLIIRDARNIKIAGAKCWVGYFLLLAVLERLQEDGTYNLRQGKPLPANSLKEVLESDHVAPRALVGLYHLFDWDG